MLGHERQAEAGADPVPGRAAPGEAFEDPCPLAGGDAGAVVLDRHQHERLPAAGLDVIRVGPPPCVVAFSSRLPRIRSKRTRSTRACAAPAVDVDRQIAVAVALGDPVAQLDEVDVSV